MKKFLSVIKNKYVISLTAFIVWLSFFDRYDITSQIHLTQELHSMEDEKAYFLNQINDDKTAMYELMHDPKTLEKFAREKYLMKKDDEEIFVIVPSSKQE
jgi:cell division protein FtsB